MQHDPFGAASPRASDPVDQVAREAARRLVVGTAVDEAAAIDAAQRHLGQPSAWPSALLVRRHVEGMEQQAQGAEAWQAARLGRLRAIEELMTLLEEHATGDRVLLVGRAARGHLTGFDPVRLRVYTDRPIRDIAAALELGGIERMEFETEDTGLGRFDALRFLDEDVASEILLVRLPSARWSERTRNLYRDEPVPAVDLDGLRRRLGEGTFGDAGAADEPGGDQSAAENAAASSSAKEG